MSQDLIHTAVPDRSPDGNTPSGRQTQALRLVLAVAVALSLARQVALLGLPLLTMHVFDSVTQRHNLDTLAVLAFAFLIALSLAAALRVMRGALIAALAEGILHRLGREASEAALRSAVLGSRHPGLAALQDIAKLRRFLSGGTVAELFDLAALPVALLVLVLLHPVYAVIAACACLLIGLLGLVLDRTSRGFLADADASRLRGAATLQGRLRQADLLEGMGMLAAVLRRWQPDQAATLACSDRAQGRARAIRGIVELAQQLGQGAIVVAGVLLVLGDRASPGSVIAAMLLAATVTQPVARLVLSWRDWSQAGLAWRRLQDLLRTYAAPTPRAPSAGAPHCLSLQGLNWTPVGALRPVLADVSLHVPAGSLTLVLGPNGVGKSSLLRLALGLLAPDAGETLLDGQDTRAVDRAWIGPRIGYLPQDVQLLEGSVLDTILRHGPPDTEGAVLAARAAGAHAMIGRLPQGYATQAGPASGLSSGQRRMIGLARALYGAPSLLALDEPEAGLDQTAREAVRDAVTKARAAGAACLLVSHDPALWQGLADQVLYLETGGTWRIELVAT